MLIVFIAQITSKLEVIGYIINFFSGTILGGLWLYMNRGVLLSS